MTPDSLPSYAWIRYSWTVAPAVGCTRCHNKVRSGVIRAGHEHLERDEWFRILCEECYHYIMSLTKEQPGVESL